MLKTVETNVHLIKECRHTHSDALKTKSFVLVDKVRPQNNYGIPSTNIMIIEA